MKIDLTKIIGIAKLDPKLLLEFLDDTATHPTIATDITKVKAGTLSFNTFISAHKDVVKLAISQLATEIVNNPTLVDEVITQLVDVTAEATGAQ